MINEYEAVRGIKIGKGNRKTCRNLVPIPICPPQIHIDCLGIKPGSP
jgi:hypothetical protein